MPGEQMAEQRGEHEIGIKTATHTHTPYAPALLVQHKKLKSDNQTTNLNVFPIKAQVKHLLTVTYNIHTPPRVDPNPEIHTFNIHFRQCLQPC